MSPRRLIPLLAVLLVGCPRDDFYEAKGRCEAKGAGWHFAIVDYNKPGDWQCIHVDSIFTVRAPR